MYFLYDLLMILVAGAVRISALFSKKMQLFVRGRKNVILEIRAVVRPSDRVLWFHAASLGEYEQGLPVMEAMRKDFPKHKIVLSFFSPSGFEVRKNNTVADVTVYLPLDRRAYVRQFLAAVHPERAFFIKYEFWPNYLLELRKHSIPTYLISGIFRPDQIFFKSYGGFFRRSLSAFTHFFVQNESSASLLSALGFYNITISGDTRFDRVAAIATRDNTLDFMEQFAAGHPVIVAGSTWPKDEELLLRVMAENSETVKWVIAPHNVKPDEIAALAAKAGSGVVLFSKRMDADLALARILIIDTVGILTKVYSYAAMAYVGGGFGNPGVHNVLEPAVFGVPVLSGPNISHFAEAVALEQEGGLVTLHDERGISEFIRKWIGDEEERRRIGDICREFVNVRRYATQRIMEQLHRDVTRNKE